MMNPKILTDKSRVEGCYFIEHYKYNIEQKAHYYDMASQVTAILRVRIDRVAKWLGEGTLLTQENLFPSPSIDQGYNNLLMHSDTFKEPFDIKKYF